MGYKTIKNYCDIANRPCTLKVDDMYFGYDNDPQYPESFYEDIKDAHVFHCQRNALGVSTWMSGKEFVIEPVERKSSTKTPSYNWRD